MTTLLTVDMLDEVLTLSIGTIGFYKTAELVQYAFDNDAITEEVANCYMVAIRHRSDLQNGRVISNAYLK